MSLPDVAPHRLGVGAAAGTVAFRKCDGQYTYTSTLLVDVLEDLPLVALACEFRRHDDQIVCQQTWMGIGLWNQLVEDPLVLDIVMADLKAAVDKAEGEM